MEVFLIDDERSKHLVKPRIKVTEAMPRSVIVLAFDGFTQFFTKLCLLFENKKKKIGARGILSYRKHNLRRAFVDFLYDNDEKVASSQKHTHIKARVQNPYPIYDQNGQNQLKFYSSLFMTKTAEKPYPLGPHIPVQPI